MRYAVQFHTLENLIDFFESLTLFVKKFNRENKQNMQLKMIQLKNSFSTK